MKTLRLAVDAGDVDSAASRAGVERAAEILRGGGTVAFPTETVYGLGANALEAAAVAKIFAAKQRPGWDPLIVHVGTREMVGRVVAEEVSQDAHRLMEAFWPGPLTLLFPRHPRIPAMVTAGLERVGVRMPAHPVAQALLRAAGIPVAAPSANLFGRTSPTRAEHVAEDLEGRIDAILDGGETTHGVESTVVDMREDTCTIYRPGVVTLEQIQAVCGGRVTVREAAGGEAAPAEGEMAPVRGEGAPAGGAVAPGQGVRHYAPRARLILVEGTGAEQVRQLGAVVGQCERDGERVGVMLADAFEKAVAGRRAEVYRWGRWEDAEELAQRLYAGLRGLDAAGVTVIVCPVPEARGIGVAVRDRLRKAGVRNAGG